MRRRSGTTATKSDDLVDESAPRGSGFLAELVEAWEAAADPARTAGLRTVHLRQGLVLSRHGGALERMLLPFKLGGGGRVGSGRQWWCWVSLADAVSAYLFALAHPLEGPFNVAAPGAVTNEEFTKELGKALHRPTLLPAPAFALRTVFGEMADEMLLGGQRVSPASSRRPASRSPSRSCPPPSRPRSPTRLGRGEPITQTLAARLTAAAPSAILRASPTKEVDSMSAIASSATRVARSVG